MHTRREAMVLGGLAAVAGAIGTPGVLAAAESAGSSALSRTERHRQMAEAWIQGHQAMTAAHIRGEKPFASRGQFPVAAEASYFGSVSGERPLTKMLGEDASNDGALKELQMFWQGMPDFGIKRYAIYPRENGWGNVLYWGGTTRDGIYHNMEEADRFITNADFQVIRMEIHCDNKQVMRTAAIALGKDPAAFTIKEYFETIRSMPGAK